MAISDILNYVNVDMLVKYGKPVLIILIVTMAYFFIMGLVKKNLLKRSKNKVMIHHVNVIFNIFNYLFIIILVLAVIFYTTGNILAFGVTAGLISAALGWALQRPITGIAAWLMVVVKKPFIIGDRILVNHVRGDVLDITLTHIYLQEVGGTVGSEEISGRIVLIPNSILFEQNIINYTAQDDFILDDVGILVTYESDLDKTIRICEAAAKKVLKATLGKMPKDPYVRVQFQGSGIDIKTRYYVKTENRIKMASEITREINKGFKKERDVNVAYPHTEVVMKKIPRRY